MINNCPIGFKKKSQSISKLGLSITYNWDYPFNQAFFNADFIASVASKLSFSS